MPPTSLRAASWLNWPVWLVLNTTGVLSGYALALLLAPAGQLIGVQVSDRAFLAVLVPLIGLTLAIAQWFLLRLHVPRAALWIPATFIGWVVPIILLLAFFAPSAANQQRQIGAVLASIGLLMGAAQYFVLRPYKPHSGWWIPASALGWLILAIGLPIPITNQLEILKVGAIPALITGIPIALVVCANSPSAPEARTMHAA